MKKFFTLIAFTCAFIPAIQGMANSLPADVQKKYDHLVALINNADVEAFKPAFDTENLPTESIAGLKQSLFEIKATINKELTTMGDNNKSWSKIAKGTLATLGGMSGVASIYCAGNRIIIDNDQYVPKLIKWLALPVALPVALAGFLTYATLVSGQIEIPVTGKRSSKQDVKRIKQDVKRTGDSILGIMGFITAYKGLTYGYENLKAGLNYKQYLQDQLTNLDAIAAHITHVKEQVAHT